MSVAPISEFSALSQQASGLTKAGRSEMDQDAFMKLLMTQMQHQDPLNPMDNTEFMGQLAQFTQIERLNLIKKGLDELTLAQLSNNAGQAVSLLGHRVRAPGADVVLSNGSSSELQYELGANAKSVTLILQDSKGEPVASFPNQPTSSGSHKVNVAELIDRSSVKIADGTYSLKIQAQSAGGEPVPSTVYKLGKVEGVTFEEGYPMVVVDGTKMRLNEIREIIE